MKKLGEIFFRKKRIEKPLEALQVGISSSCNLSCTFCPTTYIKEEASHMSLDTFSKLEPYFSWANWIYLQGWGEPLLNQNIWKMASIVKASGTKVGFTTNGTLLNTENANQLIANKIDMISVSIAGDSADIHEKLRVNSNFDMIIDNIKQLIQLKKKGKSTTPKISLSYMLTKDSIWHLPDTVKLAHAIGVDDLYAINIDYLFSEEANNNKVFNWGGKPHEDYEKLITSSKKIAAELNFSFRSYLLNMEEQEPVCELNPNRFAYITSDGEVTPCTHLSRKLNPRVYQDKMIELPQKSFGNIHTNNLKEIWETQDYASFRGTFAARLNGFNELMEVYSDYEPSLIIMESADEKYKRTMKENPLPPECVSCPKAYGL